jgi:hypothetical protein
MNRTDAIRSMLDGREVFPIIDGVGVVRCWYDRGELMPFRCAYEDGSIEDFNWDLYYCEWGLYGLQTT